MTKKNLSDLLKEEASASDTPPEDNAKAAPAVAKSQATSKRATRKAPSRSKTATKTKKPATTVPETAETRTPTKSAGTRSSRSVTKADLEQQVKQLQADIDSSKAKESAFAKQVADLQADLTEHQERLFELKDALEQSEKTAKADAKKLEKVTKELDEAKQVILKMTEAAETAEASSAEAKPVPQTKAPEAKPALAVKMRTGGSNDIYRGRRLPAHKEIPAYAIDHGEQKNRMLSNDEIGWVD